MTLFLFLKRSAHLEAGLLIASATEAGVSCNHGYVRSEDEVQWLRAMDHGEGKWTVDDDKFSNADTGSIEKQLRVLNSRFEQLLTQKPESMPPDTSGTLVCQFLVGWLLHSN